MGNPTEKFRFDVAFSFAGPNRAKVEAIAKLVAASVGEERVFFDEWYEHEILGDDMDMELQRLYHEQSLLVVADISEDYAARRWTQAEARAIRALRFEIDPARDEAQRLRLLNVRFGPGQVPGVLETTGYLDGIRHDPTQCAQLILKRLDLLRERMGLPSAWKGSHGERSTPETAGGKGGKSGILDKAFILIATETDFLKDLRRELRLQNNGTLGDRDFFGSEERKFEDYEIGWREFMTDSQTDCLVTVYPEEKRCVFSPKEQLEDLKSLSKTKKRVICFESGYRLWDMGKELAKQAGTNPVWCVTTDHDHAVKQLIERIARDQLDRKEAIHFVAILGPARNPTADMRRRIYNEFLARITICRDLSPICKPTPFAKKDPYWDEVVSPGCACKVLTTTFLRTQSWYKKEAKEAVESVRPFLGDDPAAHICFLCGNDDMALGAKEALDSFPNRPDPRNVSFVGYDGIRRMKDLLASVPGATVEVRIQDMCKGAVGILQGERSDQFIKIPAKLYPAR